VFCGNRFASQKSDCSIELSIRSIHTLQLRFMNVIVSKLKKWGKRTDTGYVKHAVHDTIVARYVPETSCTHSDKGSVS
jgi:hypothetical protein